MALEFRILGTLEVARDGEQLRLAGRLRRSLVALLVLHVGETVSSDRLIEELWPAYDPGARARLQVYVSQLRKIFDRDGEALETRPGGYALVVEPDAVDALRFERLAAVGREMLASGEPERAARTLSEALALWRGSPLGDLAYEPFAAAAVARLEELRLGAVEDRIDAELALGRHGELVAELERLVAEQPLRERLRGQLMLALYRSGRQADALSAFREARRVLREELGLEPGPELQELQQAILRQDAALRVEAAEIRARRHLPAPQTALVGRRHELDELATLLRGGTVRLLTLTGAGGSGKTRLALQVAHDLAEAFGDGVYFADLARLRDHTFVPSAIAEALAVEEQGDRPLLETLRAFLHTRRLLLLLDNFEVVDEAAPLLGELLAAASGLTLLVTSRTPLRLSAEHEYRVPPLPAADAAQLFAVRARAVAPGFRRPSEESAEVAEICRRVDFLPLGIELAAARTRELAPAELLALLPSSLELGSGGARDLPARQRTLRATIDWSYDLLDPDAKELFARLAVFAGGCTLAAAEAVCETSRSALASLVAKSLLRERPGQDAELRYVMLETVREYALERLGTSGEERAMRERHARHFLVLGERFEEGLLAGAELRPWLDRLSAEHDNVRAALDWARTDGDPELELRLATPLRPFWQLRGHLAEGRGRLEAALGRAHAASPSVRAKALWTTAVLAYRQLDLAAARQLWEESVLLYEELGDRTGLGRSLGELGLLAMEEGDDESASALYERAAEIFRADGDDRRLAVVATNLGGLALKRGDYESAERHLEASIELVRKVGDDEGMAESLRTLGSVATGRRDYARARDLFAQSMSLSAEIGFPESVAHCLSGLGQVSVSGGDAARAATLFGAAEAILESIGARMLAVEQRLHEAAVEAARLELGEDTLAAAVAAGRALTIEQAVAYALAEAEPVSYAVESARPFAGEPDARP
jgi:predicted ATPase/DNA-binding SARP family transcriptional activator